MNKNGEKLGKALLVLKWPATVHKYHKHTSVLYFNAHPMKVLEDKIGNFIIKFTLAFSSPLLRLLFDRTKLPATF